MKPNTLPFLRRLGVDRLTGTLAGGLSALGPRTARSDKPNSLGHLVLLRGLHTSLELLLGPASSALGGGVLDLRVRHNERNWVILGCKLEVRRFSCGISYERGREWVILASRVNILGLWC